MLMEVACPRLLERMLGNVPTEQNPNSELRRSMWSNIEEVRRRSSDSFNVNDNQNGTHENKAESHSDDISKIYSKLNYLELLVENVETSDLYTKLHKLELAMTEKNLIGSKSDVASNNDALYQAQNDLYAKLTKMEQNIDDLRLALQVHKSSAELIGDSVRYLHERTSDMEDELSQNSRPYESHIL